MIKYYPVEAGLANPGGPPICGRFYIAPEANLEKTFAHLQLKLFPDLPVKCSGEIAPTDIVPVFIRAGGGRTAKPMIWGFPKWDKKGVIFNARRETCLDKAMFRQSTLNRRAAVPATGFFEWTPAPGRTRKDRYIFSLPGEPFLFLAAIWDNFLEPLSGLIPERFTILTTEANTGMVAFHHRMPVILTDAEVDDWLSGPDFTKYLHRDQAAVSAELRRS